MKRRNVPWWIWLAVAAASLVVLAMITRKDQPEVYVAGAGAIAQVRPVDAPQGVKLRVRAKKHEAIARTAARVEKILGLWPESLVVAFDTTELSLEDGDLPAAQAVVRELVTKTMRTTTQLYLIGFVPEPDASPEAIAAASVMNAWWRVEICGDRAIRCVEPPPYVNEPADARRLMRDAVARALSGERLRSNEAPTAPST